MTTEKRRNNTRSASPFYGTAIETLEELKAANFGSHYLIVYPNLDTLREVYSSYIKTALYERNEIVIFLPYFETVDNVRKILSEEDSANIDVKKYENERSLVIIDSLEAYFGNPEGKMIKQILKQAKSSGKTGLSVFGDVDSFFYHLNKQNDLVEYELSLPTEYEGINLKTFCLYHKKNFDRLFTEEQKEHLLEHHGKDLIITLPSSSYISEETGYN
jgi:MEDS: MEthanogen/methylotroph, DcmR Sensory domain